VQAEQLQEKASPLSSGGILFILPYHIISICIIIANKYAVNAVILLIAHLAPLFFNARSRDFDEVEISFIFSLDTPEYVCDT